MRCELSKSGDLNDCAAIREDPDGKGFGSAAIRLSRHFHVEVDAAAFTGRRKIFVNVPVRLTDPNGDEFKGRRIGEPLWVKSVDPAKTVSLFPPAAASAGLKTGVGIAQCDVAADGALLNCATGVGRPDGLGFSEAAVVVASVMRMNLWTREGGPIDGAKISLPIRFNLGQGPAAGATPR